jgi:hypothetical protein
MTKKLHWRAASLGMTKKLHWRAASLGMTKRSRLACGLTRDDN